MSHREEGGSLKGKHSLFVGCRANALLHCLGGVRLNLYLKEVLKTNHIQNVSFFAVIKFRDQIDIGQIVCFSSGYSNRTRADEQSRRRSVRPGVAQVSR